MQLHFSTSIDTLYRIQTAQHPCENKLVAMTRQFDNKDLSSHTFKIYMIDWGQGGPCPMSSPAQTELSFYGEHGTHVNSEHGDHSQSHSRQGQTSPGRWVKVDLSDPSIHNGNFVVA